jgi:CheY-like chemotaxis protein
VSAIRRSNNVLIVEDDPSTRDLYRQALAAAGYSVTAVSDGLDALRKIETDTPDVVVLDLILPRVAGLDVYYEMRAMPSTRTIPVVVVTGADVDGLEAAGIELLLRKPIYPDLLVAAVEQLLDGRSTATP